jgi:hypothetical protein
MSARGVYVDPYPRVRAEVAGVKNIKEMAPDLAKPEKMTKFRKQIASMNLAPEGKQFLEQILKQAFPESFAESTKTVAEMFTNLQEPVERNASLWGELADAVKPTPGSMLGLNAAAMGATIGLDALSAKLATWAPPVGGTGPDGKPIVAVNAPPYAAGAERITQSGLAFVHANERIVPAKARAFQDVLSQRMITSFSQLQQFKNELNPSSQNFINSRQDDRSSRPRFEPRERPELSFPDISGGGQVSPTINYSPQVTVHVSGDKGDVSKQVATALDQHYERTFPRLIKDITRTLDEGRARA